MGADVSASSSSAPGGRGGAASSSEAPRLAQCLPLEPISLGNQKYTRAGELRRALGFSLVHAAGNHPFGVSNQKHSPPVAPEELRHYKDSVTDGSRQARERSRMFHNSIYKLDKYREAIVLKRRQRTNLSITEKSGGSTNLKKGSQISRNLHDHSSTRSEGKAKINGFNKRARSSSADLKVNSKSGVILRENMINEKETEITKTPNEAPVQPEERIRRLSVIGEGWEQSMKRKRSAGPVGNRASDSDVKPNVPPKLSSDPKLTSFDPHSLRANASQATSLDNAGTFIKGKIARAPRTGTPMTMNSADVQMSSKASGGCEQPAGEVHTRGTSASSAIAPWASQRSQKNSRARRTPLVSPARNYGEARDPPPSSATSGFGPKSSSDRNDGSMASDDTESSVRRSKMKLEDKESPVLLSEVEQTRVLEHDVKEKGPDSGDVLFIGNHKVRSSAFPMKRKQALPSEDIGYGVSKQGRTGRGLSLPKPESLQMSDKLENVSMTKSLQNPRLCSDKNRSKSGRPPSKKLSDRKGPTRSWKTVTDDDHEELVVAATSARKASYIACSSRFWKKMEPIFGPVSAEDTCYLKHQLSTSEKLEDSLPQLLHADYDDLGIFTHDKTSAIAKQGSLSCQLLDQEHLEIKELGVGRRSEKVSSLYQRVLSALIEEDESEVVCNGSEGISTSFQCTSDDSHCGSCNYTDVEMRERDRLESEADSIVEAQIPRRCSGDRFSCNKSFTSNTSRNLSMSDSLYSSGRWQDDDSFSHSDVEFVSGICQNDQGGSQPGDVNLLAAPVSDCQYQLLCVDDRLLLELQSVGLFLDAMPDLAEGEEVIDQDIMELKEGLHQQVGKKKMKLTRIEKAVFIDKDGGKKDMEHAAMNQLIEMAYKRRMACKRNNSSKTVLRKVSKQVGMGFIERTLARCRNFELTGRSCFSDPALLKIILSAPQGNDVKFLGSETDRITCHGAPKHQAISGQSGGDSTILSGPDSQNDNGRGSLDFLRAAGIATGPGSAKRDASIHKGRRELLLDDVGGVSHPRGGTYVSTALMSNSVSQSSQQSAGNFKAEGQTNAKPKHTGNVTLTSGNQLDWNLKDTTVPAVQASSTFVQPHPIGTQIAAEEEEEPIDFSKLPMPEFESIEQLGGSNDPDSWFNLDDVELHDHDSIGLEIPKDDISDLIFL